MFHFRNIYCFLVAVLQNETFCKFLEAVPNSHMFSDSAKMRYGFVIFN